MVTISKADAQNDIEQLWNQAAKEPVTVLRAYPKSVSLPIMEA